MRPAPLLLSIPLLLAALAVVSLRAAIEAPTESVTLAASAPAVTAPLFR